MPELSFPPSLAAAATGLLFISESDYPLEPVVVASPGWSGPVADALLQHLGLPAGTPVQEQDLAYFLRNHTRRDAGFSPERLERARQFGHLQQVLEQELRDIKVYRVGQIQVQAFILGRDARGQLAGLKTTQIET
ncbi:MAG: nuclease A inhibitor family protein [Adhaeribacter sp.]